MASDSDAAAGSIWTPDSKYIATSYSSPTHPPGPYLIDLNGKVSKILKRYVTYFYADGYNYLYVGDLSDNYSVYRSNIDGTVNDSLVALGSFINSSSGGLSVNDFDPYSNELLIDFDDPSTALPNMIAKYDLNNHQLSTIATSDTGSKYYSPKFTRDYKKVLVKETQFELSSKGV